MREELRKAVLSGVENLMRLTDPEIYRRDLNRSEYFHDGDMERDEFGDLA